MNPQVTVYIPFYNRRKYLRETIASVYEQTFQNWKIILIDDGSDDGSLETIIDYLKDNRILLIKNNENIGKSKSLNKALRLTDTPFAIELDSDDSFFPWTIETLINEGEKQPEDVAVIGGNIMLFQKKENRIINRIKKGQLYKNKYDFLLENRVIWPRFYRTSALKKVGGWPTDDPYEGNHSVDDVRILLKLVEFFSLHWIDQVLYKVRLHESNISNDRKIHAEVKKWAVRDALKRWGDQYEPTFYIDEEGWCYVDKLIPK